MKILITGVHGFVGSNLGNCSVNPAIAVMKQEPVPVVPLERRFFLVWDLQRRSL